MASTSAHVRDGVLTLREGGHAQLVTVGTSAWKGWLEQPSTKAFRFEHSGGSFTARQELKAGHPYWYAYRRRGGHLRKAYLGRSTELTLGRLHEVGARLNEAVYACAPHTAESGPHARLTLGSDHHNLPAEVSSFVGRAAEMSELECLLSTTRLLTLTRSGGVGKTRLALHLASDVMEKAADVVGLVDLGPWRTRPS